MKKTILLFLILVCSVANASNVQVMRFPTGQSVTVSTGGGGGSSSGAAGLVQISGGSGAFDSTSTFFYDKTNDFLGIGITAPNYGLDVYRSIPDYSISHFGNSVTGPGAAQGGVFGIDATGNAVIQSNSTANIVILGNMLPYSTNTYSIGTPSACWTSIVGQVIRPSGTDTGTLGDSGVYWAAANINTINLETNIIPTVDYNSNLGGASNHFNIAYIRYISYNGTTWNWPTADASGAMMSNGSGGLSFNASPSFTALSFGSTLTGPGSFNIDSSGNLNATAITMSGGISAGAISGSSINANSGSVSGASLNISGHLADGTYPCAVVGSITISNGVISAIS